MAKRRTVADIAIEVAKSRGRKRISWDDIWLLDEIAHKAKEEGISNIFDKHPLDRHVLLLNRLENDLRLKKYHYKIFTGAGRRHHGESWCRTFEIIESEG